MKEKAEMTREELIALGWMKKPSDKMQEKPKNQLTAVEWLVDKLAKNGVLHSSNIAKAKEMEKEQMIKFASYYTPLTKEELEIGFKHKFKKQEQ